MCSVLFSVYKAPLCKGSWLPQGRLRQGIDRLHSLVSGLPAWRGRSPLGVPFCCQKGTKDHQRRGLPPPCGIHPAVLGGTCTFLFSALGPARSHRWHGYSTECSCFSGRQHFYCQGLTLVCNCYQLPEAWLPAAGTPLLQGRPGCGNHPAIGPAAQGSLVWWQEQKPQQG